MPQAALGLLQRKLHSNHHGNIQVSMPQAALGLLQHGNDTHGWNAYLRFNAASGIRTVATARLMEPRPIRAESVRLKKAPQKRRKRQFLTWTRVLKSTIQSSQSRIAASLMMSTERPEKHLPGTKASECLYYKA